MFSVGFLHKGKIRRSVLDSAINARFATTRHVDLTMMFPNLPSFHPLLTKQMKDNKMVVSLIIGVTNGLAIRLKNRLKPKKK